ncbi:MAG: PQQ-binding-like beta-propeller repeat protein [Thermoanaerobaculia bacterium]
MRAAATFAALLLVSCTLPVLAEEPAGWNQWAGPLSNGTSPATDVFRGGFRLREVWRRPADGGISALAVAGERLFSLASAEGNDYAFALDAGTGKEIWRVALGASVPAMEYGAASTPATDGRRVYLHTPQCRLLALEAATGKTAWQHDLRAEYNTGAMASGCWSSPLLDGDLLILQVNGEPDKRVMAFDKASGAVAWSSPGRSRSTRSSPLIADLAGVRQVVVHDVEKGKGGLYGLRLKDGALLWSLRFAEGESFANDTPLPLGDDRVGIITWSDFRAVRVTRKGEAWEAAPAWSSRDFRAEVQPVTLHAAAAGQHVYGYGGENLSCLEAATGKPAWKEKIYPGSLILVDGHLVALSQSSGLLRVLEATPAGYREKARQEVFTPGAISDTPPSFAGRRIYLRNSEEMVALEVVREGSR